MAATFNVMFDFGGVDGVPGTNQSVDALGPPNLRFKQADNALIDNNDSIPVPAVGTNYSYWKQIYLKCTAAPAVQCDNFKFYTDGVGYGAGITLSVGNQFPTKNSASSAGYEVADAAVLIVGNHGGIAAVSNAFGFIIAAPLAGPTISEAGNIINAQNETTNYLVLQIEVTGAASAGNKADETLTFRYDEI